MASLRASDGCGLHYETEGEGTDGEVPLVLIPGLGGDGRFWDPVRALLAPHLRLVVVDHRGAGRCDRPPGPYSIARIAADVREVMDALAIPRAHLLGHSTGGTVAQTLALDSPGRADRLVLSGTWAAPDARFRLLFRARLALLEQDQPAIYQQFTHLLGYDAAYLTAHEHDLAAAVARAGQTLAPLEVAAARIRMLLGFDRLADLGSLTAPTLVIGAGDDEMVPYTMSEQLAAAIPGAALARMAGGHFYPRVHPQAFARHVLDFLG